LNSLLTPRQKVVFFWIRHALTAQHVTEVAISFRSFRRLTGLVHLRRLASAISWLSRGYSENRVLLSLTVFPLFNANCKKDFSTDQGVELEHEVGWKTSDVQVSPCP